MTKLYAINPDAAIYLKVIPLYKSTLHVHYDATPLYGRRTTNFVEIGEQSVSAWSHGLNAVRVLQSFYEIMKDE